MSNEMFLALIFMLIALTAAVLANNNDDPFV